MHARSLAIAALALFSRSQGCTHTDPMNADPVDRAQPAAPAGSVAPAATPQSLYRVPTDGLPAMGDAHALVTVVAFTDYECTYCRRAEASIAALRREFPADVRVAVSELPLPMHDRAKPAALAALAAAPQGAYESMRARMFAGPLDDASIRTTAQSLGLDMARFDADHRVAGAQPLTTFEKAIAKR